MPKSTHCDCSMNDKKATVRISDCTCALEIGRVHVKLGGWNLFDELLIALKERLSDRKFLIDDKVWCCADDEDLQSWISEVAMWDVEIKDRNRQPPPPPRNGSINRIDQAYDVLFLRKGAPLELISAARKILARINHPDIGGNLQTMQRINVAADMLEKQFKR